jgi:hypothetical protein
MLLFCFFSHPIPSPSVFCLFPVLHFSFVLLLHVIIFHWWYKIVSIFICFMKQYLHIFLLTCLLPFLSSFLPFFFFLS